VPPAALRRNPPLRLLAAALQRGIFSFYNRADGVIWEHIRNTLDAWFAGYPAEHAADLRGRFRSKREGAHVGAFWELYLHRLLHRMGYEVAVHPAVPDSSHQPDFEIARAGERLYVEAAVVCSGIVDDDADPVREGWIMDIVNKATHPNFYVGLEFEARGNTPPRDRTVIGPLIEWLDSLDPDAVDSSAAPPSKRIIAGEWRLVFDAVPIVPEARGKRPAGRLLGYGPPTTGFVDDITQVRDTLKRKRGRYGQLDLPLVVAIRCSSTFLKPDDVAAVLYGSRAYQYTPGTGEAGKLVRQRDGTWMSERGPTGTRMSAVLTMTGLDPGTMGSAAPWLWHNPWAQRPLTVDWPFSTGVASDRGEVATTEREVDMAALLGLRRDWPGT
jgi:hypothetical protein